jgi:hypothetical protein
VNWHIYASSIEGSSHLSKNLSCQDANQCRRVLTPWGEYAIIVVSDGCGTAKHADLGAKIVTTETLECLEAWLISPILTPDLSDLIEYSLGHAHQCLIRAAEHLSVSAEELAATCICLVIGPDRYAAAQIGDGVIVRCSSGICGCLFWQKQEYANVTHSLTAKDWRDNMQIAGQTGSNLLPDSWFIATDGIQAISCDNKTKTPSSGFVPLLIDKFRSLSHLSEDRIQKSLEAFLRSEKVSSSVSDDKTIAIAFR